MAQVFVGVGGGAAEGVRLVRLFLEDVAHLFLHCDFFRQIWFDVYDWLGFVLKCQNL